MGKKHAFLKSKERQEGVGRQGEARVLISMTSVWALQNKDWGSGGCSNVRVPCWGRTRGLQDENRYVDLSLRRWIAGS